MPRAAGARAGAIEALLAPDDDMGPRWYRGERVYLDRGQEPIAGGHALVAVRPLFSEPVALARQLVGETPDAVELLQHTPKRKVWVSRSSSIARCRAGDRGDFARLRAVQYGAQGLA